MGKFLTGTRYLVVLPVVGLAVAAAFFFVFGGYGLLRLLFELLLGAFGVDVPGVVEMTRSEVVVEIVEFVHLFLVGTVLYITAVGLYQLFVQEIKFPGWLKIDSTEELETNLIGVTVVVLAVNFMGIAFTGDADLMQEYGIGIALPIAALALFVGLRTWSTNLVKKSEFEEEKYEEKKSVDHSSSEN